MNSTGKAADEKIASTILDLARVRGQGNSFCPSEAARRVQPDAWQPLMPDVRRVAARLQRDGLIHATQGGRAVDALEARGPIRLSRPPH